MVLVHKPKQGSQTNPQFSNLVTSFGKLKESIHIFAANLDLASTPGSPLILGHGSAENYFKAIPARLIHLDPLQQPNLTL